RHRARAELERYLPIEVQFDAVAGTDDAVLLELSPLPKRSRTPQRVAGWSLLGIGLAATAVGAPLVALHGRPYERKCSGMDIDGDGDCRFTYGTRTGGAVALAIGGAAIITAIVLLATARRKHHGAISKAPMLGGIPQHSPR
ncbi:MAG TPA: hypothetical protein VG755_11385, partial [Nannocystaceae bacterium]|nr:hypothetical protein [Nannocystaceae bacterium]